MAKTVRMTVAQAIVKFLDNQYDSSQSSDMESQLDLEKHLIPIQET